MKDMSIFKIYNGLESLIIKRPNTGLFYISIVVKTGIGTKYQNEQEIEYAHFLEHFNAKYTSKKYPKYKEILSKLQFYGISSNAYTTNEITCYWLYGSISNMDFIMDLLLNSYANFQIDEELLEREREAILNELYNRKFNNSINFYDSLQDIYNLGFSIEDRIKSSKEATLDKLLNFRKKYYYPKNSKIIVTGDINLDYIKKYLQNFFKNNSVSNSSYELFPYIKPNKIDKFIFKKRLDLESIILNLIYKIKFKEFTQDVYLLNYIVNILNQRLMRNLRYEGGKVYYVSVSKILINDFCFIRINTEFRNGNDIEFILKIIINEINRINKGDISENRFLKSKNFVKVEFLKQSLDNDLVTISNNYINEFIADVKLVDMNEKMENYLNKDLNDIINYGKDLFKSDNMNIIFYAKNDLVDYMEKII